MCELVVAYTDRVVRSYRWSCPEDTNSAGKTQMTASFVDVDKWLLTGQVILLHVVVYDCILHCTCGYQSVNQSVIRIAADNAGNLQTIETGKNYRHTHTNRPTHTSINCYLRYS